MNISFKKSIVVTTSVISMLLSLGSSASLFQPDSATASSEFDSRFSIDHVINGSGLPTNFTAADAHADYAINNHWTTKINQVPTNSNATFLFNNDVTIGTFYLWNHRSNVIADNSLYAVTEFDLILYDAADAVLLSLTGLTSVGQTAFSQSYAFSSIDGVRKVDFNIISNEFLDAGNNNSAFTGVAEVAFDSVGAVPIPAAAWLFGSGLISLIGLSRRK